MKKKIILLVLALFCVMSFVACDKCGNDTTSYDLEVEQYIELNLYDEDRKITVNSTNPDETIKFECDSEAITVLADGTIVTKTAGEATVKVSCGNIEKSCTVKVKSIGDIPVIVLTGISNEINLIVGDVFPLDYTAVIENHAINGEFTFFSADETVLEVGNDGVVRAKGKGNTTLTIVFNYKIWEVYSVLDVSVGEDKVVKLSQNRISLTTTSGLTGFYTSKAIEFLGVYDNGVKVDGATVTWESVDNNVVTVENGVISAVKNGKTYVKAIYDNGASIGYVLVEVANPYLSKPQNLSVKDGTFSWDSVVNASGYVVSDSYSNTLTVKETNVDLNKLNPNGNYFRNVGLYVSAISSVDNVENSKYAEYDYYAESLSKDTEFVKHQDRYEAQINEYVGTDFVADIPIYRATVTSDAVTTSAHGYLFKKIFYTNSAYRTFGGQWCNYSVLGNVKVSNFYDSKISFWVYSEKEITISYMKLDVMFVRESIYKQVIEADKWTKFSCSMSSNDFPYVTMLAATGDFYFTDFRISDLSYMSTDYSNIDKSIAKVQEVIDLIGNLPEVTTDDTCGTAIKEARDKYDALSDSRKVKITNYATLMQKEKVYGELVYDTVKTDTAFVAAENLLKDYAESYNGVFLKNFTSVEKKAKTALSAVAQLKPAAYYGLVIKSENYARFITLRADYKLIEDTKGNVKDRIVKSSYPQTAGTGFVEINNGDLSPNIASALVHPIYGTVLTMGTNPRVDSAINFKNKNSINLDGYTHVIFAAKNPRDEKMGVYLYGSKGRVKALAENIAKTDNYGEWTEMIMTVEEFLQYDISFGYEQRPANVGSIWLTAFIAIKLDVENNTDITELNGILTTLSGNITLSDNVNIERAKTLYSNLSETEKTMVSSYDSVIAKAESRYAVLLVEDKISKIGTVEVTEACIKKVSEARDAYNSLNASQRETVANYSVLTRAESELTELLKPDATAQAVIDEIQTFIDGYTGINLEKLKTVQASISTLDSKIAALSETQKITVSNMAKYNEIKSSFVVVDDMKGAVASRFTIKQIDTSTSSETNGSIGNGNETNATLKPSLYGQVGSIGMSQNVMTVKFNNTDNLALSAYDRVLIGIKNGLTVPISFTSINTTSVKEEEYYSYYAKKVPASMEASGTYYTLVLTVDEFLEGFRVTKSGSSGNIWLTSIIAIKGAVTNQYYYDMYKDELTEDGITSYESIKVIEDLRGADVADGLSMNAAVNGINNGETAPNLSEALYDETYGPIATIGVNMSNNAVIKLSEAESAKLDLSGYNYVYFAIKNSSAGNVAVKYGETSQQIEQGSWGVVKMTVEQFLENGIEISKTQQGSIWLAPIIAAK